MNRRKFLLMMLVTVLFLALTGPHFGIATAEKPRPQPPYMDPSLPVEKRVKDLLRRMTLEEKVGQITQINVTRLMGEDEWDRGPLNEEWMKKVLVDNRVGSILSGGGAAPVPNNPKAWAKMTNTLQRYALRHSRLKIPIIYGVDAVHGHNNVLGATIYPHNIGLANSWNPALVREINERTAKEVRATGIHWNFSPAADIARDLRWGRYYETFGEDPLLASEMVGAAVTGLQGDHLSSPNRVAASAKHFVGYSQPLSGEDRAPAELSLRTLREMFLPGFERAIQDGAETIMVNSGSVNGIPVHASKYLLTDVLRKELGFEGVVVSDWEDIIKLHTVHRIAPTYKEAIRISINAGVDMSMVPLDAEGFTKNLIELVQEKKVSEKRIDEAVGRILTLKFRLGLFENPYVDEEKAEKIIVDRADRELARRAATQSITLLKNDKHLLPLKKDLSTILVTGPGADNPIYQMGGWTIGWQGVENLEEMPPSVTVLEGIKGKVSKNTRVLYEPGVPPEDRQDDPEAVERAIRKAVNAAKKADVILVVVGELPYAEGEGDTSTAALPPAQTQLIRALKGTKKDVAVILLAGRPLMMTETIRSVPAFLMAYLPGTEGGNAVADILFGDANPSGKLASTWPKRIGQVPTFYNHPPGASYDPLFPFGYGLSYTRFSYENFQVPKTVQSNGKLRVAVTVTNTGKRAGDEIVQIYADRQYRSVLSPVRQLVAFQRVSLKPGESKRITLNIPVSRFSVIPGDILGTDKRIVEPGTYQLRVGDMTKTFTISK